MNASNNEAIKKCPTGIQGLDEITNGGLPLGRTALVCGAAGCGKTVLAMQVLVNGAVYYGEPGVFMSFEESDKELAANFASLGFNLSRLIEQDKLRMDYVHLERSEISETGDYDLEGLFVRLDYAINEIGAKRVVLDTIEALFSGLDNAMILRAELRRLFRWLKERGVTAIVTGEQGGGLLTRQGIEEYVSDFVLVLDHRVINQVSTRRMRIVKYRGSAHGTNEYPFLVDEQGICVLPITSVGLNAEALDGRISSGIDNLDRMLGGQGFFRGSSILISGKAGTGKTTLAATAVDAACRRGDRCLYFAFEESESQIIRNMRSIGLDLVQWRSRGNLAFVPARPTLQGLEMHLATMYKKINEFKPDLVVLDPISNLTAIGNFADIKIMLVRIIDFIKNKNITLFLLDLSGDGGEEKTDIEVSSLADTWVGLKNIETGGERNRGLHILKSRGMDHSSQLHELVFGDGGLALLEAYSGDGGILFGSARHAQQAREKARQLFKKQEYERRRRVIDRKRRKMEVAIAEMQAALEAEEAELEKLISEEQSQQAVLSDNRL